MLTRRNNSRGNCLRLSSKFNEIHGRHVGTRTPDLYRVKFEVNNPKPFSCLAFPFSGLPKRALKRPIFGDELVTSFVRVTDPSGIFCKQVFGTPQNTTASHFSPDTRNFVGTKPFLPNSAVRDWEKRQPRTAYFIRDVLTERRS